MKAPLRLAVLLCLTVAGLLQLAARPAPQTPREPKAAQDTPAIAPAGDRVVFKVDWNPPWYLFFLPSMEAGEAELRVSGETPEGGRPRLKITFQARSSGTLVKLAKVRIDDHFEFYTDADTLCTMRVSKRLWEGKRRRIIDVVYEPEQSRLYIKEIDPGVNPPVVKKDKYVEGIPPCVKDLFSALQSIRRRNLSVGFTQRSIVGDNDTIKEVEARVEKRESVDTPAGRFDTWRINTVAIFGGLFKEGGQFRMWLTADERKLPVQFEAKASIGTVEGRLKLYERSGETPATGTAGPEGGSRSRP